MKFYVIASKHTIVVLLERFLELAPLFRCALRSIVRLSLLVLPLLQ